MSKLAMVALAVLVAVFAWTVHWSWGAWTEVRPQGGNYRLLMPSTPEVEQLQLPLADGRTIRLQQVSVLKDGVGFFASHVDYPADMVRSAPAEQLLANVRDGTAKGHTLVSDKPISMAGKVAREYVILRSDEPVHTLTRSVLIGNRLYQLLVASRTGLDNNPDIRKFMDSFALLP
ncbi:MAG: hypothetical protein JNL04_00665 [Rhodospirillaceae bacterium]|nr:hypothetical protein [Rhodospirillaceae bacterium]